VNVDWFLAAGVLIIHLLFIAWVIFGAILTRGHRFLTGLHLASLVYVVVIEAGPWPCPLTGLEDYFRQQGGAPAYHEPFLVHYLEILIYPSVSELLLVWCAIAVAAINLAVYALRLRK
jgi:Protein of Unknown function (DUF2784)